jgi:hypothetical protein
LNASFVISKSPAEIRDKRTHSLPAQIPALQAARVSSSLEIDCRGSADQDVRSILPVVAVPVVQVVVALFAEQIVFFVVIRDSANEIQRGGQMVDAPFGKSVIEGDEIIFVGR